MLFSVAGKREVSNYTMLMDNDEFNEDFNAQDERDRRAIDEEDDEDFLQELNILAQEVKREYDNIRFTYENDGSILSVYSSKFIIRYLYRRNNILQKWQQNGNEHRRWDRQAR